jgi:hypothetical protein
MSAWTDSTGIQHRPLQVVIDKKTYDDLVAAGLNPQDYIQRHVDEMNRILAQSGANVRIDLADIRYVDAVTNDQRGPWIQSDAGNWALTGGFNPSGLGYWNSDDQIDYGLIHEWGHAVLGLWDDYGFDVQTKSDSDPFDFGDDVVHHGPTGLMSDDNPPLISPWQVALLNEGIKNGVGFDPGEFIGVKAGDLPTQAELDFGTSLAGAKFHIFGTELVNGQKDVHQPALFDGALDASGHLTLDGTKLFADILNASDQGSQQNLARSAGGTFLVEIDTASGPVFRWIDLSMFVAAKAAAGGSNAVVIH